MTLFLAAQGQLQGHPGRTQPVALKEDVDFVYTTDELRATPTSHFPLYSAPISL